VIGGGGFAGLSAGAQLRLAGFQNLRIIEKGGDFGGAWLWNRYPVRQCDIESTAIAAARRDELRPDDEVAFRPRSSSTSSASARHSTSIRDALFQTQITEMLAGGRSKWQIKTDAETRSG